MKSEIEAMVLNGGHGEGGGTLVRTAVALSSLTGRPLRIHNVRGALRRPGLSAEDMTYIDAAAASCEAIVEMVDVGSREFVFSPTRAPRALNHGFDVCAHEQGTVPGNTVVIAHDLLPLLARSGAYSKVTLRGETHGSNTLSYEPFERVVLDVARAQGLHAFTYLESAGFGYGARGELSLEVEPSALEPIDWTHRGELLHCKAVVAMAELSKDIGVRGVDHVLGLFRDRGLDADVELVTVPSKMSGLQVTCWCRFERGVGCGSAMGQRGLRVEAVADQAFGNLMEWYSSEATVDAHVADQILVTACLAEGRTVFSTPRITRRLTTMAWIIRQFMPIHVTVHGQEGGPGTVNVER